MLLEDAIVVGKDASRQLVVPLRLDFDVDQYPIFTAIAQVDCDQVVGDPAGRVGAEARLCQLLIQEARPA